MNESQFKISSEMSVVPKTKKNHKILVVGVLPSILVVGVLPSYCRITRAIRIRQVLIHRERELVLFLLANMHVRHTRVCKNYFKCNANVN
jgi:hypothetical protein